MSPKGPILKWDFRLLFSITRILCHSTSTTVFYRGRSKLKRGYGRNRIPKVRQVRFYWWYGYMLGRCTVFSFLPTSSVFFVQSTRKYENFYISANVDKYRVSGLDQMYQWDTLPWLCLTLRGILSLYLNPIHWWDTKSLGGSITTQRRGAK